MYKINKVIKIYKSCCVLIILYDRMSNKVIFTGFQVGFSDMKKFIQQLKKVVENLSR